MLQLVILPVVLRVCACAPVLVVTSLRILTARLLPAPLQEHLIQTPLSVVRKSTGGGGPFSVMAHAMSSKMFSK